MIGIFNPGTVVATVTSPSDLAFLATKSASPLIDVFEFRLDNLADHWGEAEKVAGKLAKPVLITARHPDEGGHHQLSENQRLELLRRFLPVASLLDIEVRTLRESSFALNVIQEAAAGEVSVIASFHDFEKTPAESDLRETVQIARESGAQVAKIAVYLDEMEKLFDLATLTSDTYFPVSSMGMGPLGKLSRLVLAKAGSVLNYGYLQEPNAPGQWSAEALKKLINEL